VDSNKRTATSQKITNYFSSVPATKKHKPTDDKVAIINNLSDSKKVSN